MATTLRERNEGRDGKAPLSVLGRLREQALDPTIKSDPKYKKYTQQLEKCLASFENMHEWPDFIAFLKQLLKTLQSYTQFKEVPKKLIVAKRLSQCLIPALPSGVHQRALDVYSHILSVLGKDGLKRDLPLWSSGLFPFFEYASTSVKPTLLGIFEQHYLPLHDSLRPIMRSFILALLPGLEEETSEYFERVMALLDRVSAAVTSVFFLQNIWLIVLTTQISRSYALNYLSRRLPRLDASEDITTVVGRDVGLMIRAFAAALSDDNLLVQRGALDLLVTSLRLDSSALSTASPQDRTILMRAATGVVLRRDLSLNRRLFSWLLGPDEHAEKQTEYYRQHSLDLLVTSLKDEMLSPSTQYSSSRPFKIFISLLDKWEIGSPLTDALLYDALKCIQNSLVQNMESAEDILLTANTLYDAVEPKSVWKQIFKAVRTEMLSDGHTRQATDMALFILRTFHSEDEEVQNFHLPLIFCALVEILQSIARMNPTSISTISFRAGMELLAETLQHVPMSAMTVPLRLSDIAFGGSFDEAACLFYDLQEMSENELSCTPQSSSPITFISSFENLTRLTAICMPKLKSNPGSMNDEGGRGLYLETFTDLISLLLSMLRTLEKQPLSTGTLAISWDPVEWLNNVLAVLDNQDCTFQAVDRVTSIAIALHNTSSIHPVTHLHSRPRLSAMMNSLLGYLRPKTSAYHVRAVNLIWELQNAAKAHHLESIISLSLTRCTPSSGYSPYESFGVFWRLTEDAQLPGVHFKIPLFIVLDALNNEDPALRRVAETWLRCNLRSYHRALDPILIELLDPSIHRIPETIMLKGRELQTYVYDRPFDQHRISYLLGLLLQVANFGGQSFVRVASSSVVARSLCSRVVERCNQAGLNKDSSYKSILIDLLLLFLQSEPTTLLVQSMDRSNVLTQGTSVDLLLSIVSRGDSDRPTIDTIESTIIKKLFLLVHTEKLQLQNKLLHLLHSVTSASASLNDRVRIRSGMSSLQHGDGVMQGDLANDAHAPVVNPLLLQCLVDGISTPSNRPLLHHWLDFVLMTMPQFPHILAVAITPLNACICRQLRDALEETLGALATTKTSSRSDIQSNVDDADFLMLMNALERLILLSLDDPQANYSEIDNISNEKHSDSTGILTMVSNVFLPDSQSQPGEVYMTVRSPAYRCLHEGVCLVYSIWAVVSKPPSLSHPAGHTLAQFFTRIFGRCRKVLERLFRSHSFEVIESVIESWSTGQSSAISQGTGFEVIDFLTSSAQNVVHMVCESISLRISNVSDRARKQVLNPELSDATLFMFLEQYMEKLEGPLAVQVWARYFTLAKDVASNAKEYRAQVFPVLRCLTVLALKVTQTAFADDRRVRKDLQETYGKLSDACVLISGRSLDQGIWPRRTRDTLVVNGRDSPVPSVLSESNLQEKLASSPGNIQDAGQPASGTELIDKINEYFAQDILPNLRRLLMDNDKMLTICTNVTYYVVNPALKARVGRLSEVDDIFIALLEQMARLPATFKAWRNSATDVLYDNRFFNVYPKAGLRWRVTVKALFESDKAALSELLGRISSAPSANIFTNREYEMGLRAQNIRRLSFVLLSSEKNQFLTQLPSIQEKLVDILRVGASSVVESEVYLCIRVLLCRLSPHNLSSFWPVLLAEMIRIFGQIVSDPPSDGSESLHTILSACKLLDLLLVLQTEEFQIHQWIFITDTADAVYRPDSWFPESLMDQLSDIIGDIPVTETKQSSGFTMSDALTVRGLRQPFLSGVRQIDSIRDLAPFFSNISIMTYEAVYASDGLVDWDIVEQSLAEDMFDVK